MVAEQGSQTLAIAIAAGVFSQCVGRLLRLPGIVVLLALGFFLGPEGLGWVHPDSLGDFLFWIVDFAVAIILFEGGLNLQMSRLRRQEMAIRRLVTIGAVVTLLGAAVSAHFLLDWSWLLALLFGSHVVVTGPTVVTPLLRDLRLRPKIKTVLEAEGVLIDPIGAILAVLVLQVALIPAAETLQLELYGVAMRLGFGLVAGVIAGFLIGGALRLRFLVPKGLENIFTLAAVILTLFGCDQVISHSGILAVTIAGVVVGNMPTEVDRDLREFKDQLTVLLVGTLFIILAADIGLDDVLALGWPAMIVVASLIVFVRPLTVALSTAGSELSLREKVFIAWIAPRGIVAAAIVSLTVAAMETEGMAGGTDLKAIVFLTIATTVVLAGFTARPLASLLKLRLPGRDRVAILGAQGLGLALGRELRDGGRDVVFFDSDPERCRRAQEDGFTVIFGDALEERTQLRGQIELVGQAIGLTPNDHLNSLFVGQAKEGGGVPEGLVGLTRMDSDGPPDHVKRHGGKVLFDGQRDIGRWDVRARHGTLELVHLTYDKNRAGGDSLGDQQGGKPRGQGIFVPLAYTRGDKRHAVTMEYEAKDGDVISFALHTPDRERALEQLAELGWVPEEDEAEVALSS